MVFRLLQESGPPLEAVIWYGAGFLGMSSLELLA